MSSIAEVLVQNILPIFFVAAFGFWLQRVKKVDVRPVASMVFNGFSPALVFTSLINSQLPMGELAQLSLFALVMILAMGALGLAAGRALHLSRPDTIVLLLTLMFVNSGNYGLTLNQIRYGDVGLSRAIVYYTVSTLVVYSLGVFIISMGNSDWRAALHRLVRIPAFYAVLLSIIFYSLQLPVPGPVMSALEVAAAGAIPAMIVVLGMNIAELPGLTQLRLTIPAVSLRLVVGPFVALGIATWVGLQGLNRSTAIIEASMPTAVLTTVLATEFDVKPAVVTSIVVLSTVLSPITLALFITLFNL